MIQGQGLMRSYATPEHRGITESTSIQRCFRVQGGGLLLSKVFPGLTPTALNIIYHQGKPTNQLGFVDDAPAFQQTAQTRNPEP